ncbi:CHASE2 domain-containing protein [Phormidesmis sp. 146-33]
MKRLKQQLWQGRGVLIAAPSVTAIVLLVRLSGSLQFLEWAMFDHWVRLRPSEARETRITLVGVTESDVQRYGTPLTDETLAAVLEKLKQHQPAAIGLDLYRDIPVGKGYDRLVKVFRSTPNLIGVQKVVSSAASGSVAPAPVLQQLNQVAANDVLLDTDGKIRRGLLSVMDGDIAVPSFAAMLSTLYLEKQGIFPQEVADSQVKLGKTIIAPFQEHDGGYVGAEIGGYQILLNYRGGRNSFDHVSVQQVLEGTVDPNLLKGRILIMGATAESLKDSFLTPYRDPMLGVEIHAALTSQLINTALFDRPLIQSWSDVNEGIWIFSWSVIGALLVWRRSRRFDSLQLLVKFLAATVILGAISYLVFLKGWWIPIVPAGLSLAGATIAITAFQAQSSSQLRKTFGRYLTDEVVTQLLETPEGLTLKGEKRKVTTLISDLRGFTHLSEKLAPEEVVRMLNLYLSDMTRVIKSYGGTINDLTGDGIVVLFGAPLQKVDDAERAVACAIAMQLAMTSVNQRNQELNLPVLEMGIGLNTGEVVVGNIGSEDHTKYTAIGSHVNLAARIESFTTGGQVLISPNVWQEVREIVTVESQTEVLMKGMTTPTMLYEISAIAGCHTLKLPSRPVILKQLASPIVVRGFLLDGKHLTDQQVCGELVRLSHKVAHLQTVQTLLPLTNLKLNLALADSEVEVYAKVLNQKVDQGTGYYIQWTTVAPELALLL